MWIKMDLRPLMKNRKSYPLIESLTIDLLGKTTGKTKKIRIYAAFNL